MAEPKTQVKTFRLMSFRNKQFRKLAEKFKTNAVTDKYKIG
jgi:hypothetical protein